MSSSGHVIPIEFTETIQNILRYMLHQIIEYNSLSLNAFFWYQIVALDSAVVEVQEMFSSHGSFLTIAMYHHGETL